MGETIRTSTAHLNGWVRNSDLRGAKDCALRSPLSMLWPEPLPAPIWFAVGTAVHYGIEDACRGATLDESIATAMESLDIALDVSDGNVIETAKRNVAGAPDEIYRMMNRWWTDVHPESDSRMQVYRELEWPPQVEVDFYGDGFAGQIDAIFTHAETGVDVLVDWKTGGGKKSGEDQLHFYHHGMRKCYPEYHNPNFAAWFHHVQHGTTQEVGDYFGDYAVEEWIRWMQEQKRSRTFPPFPGWYCDYCECKSVCPIYEDTEEQVKELIAASLLDEQHPHSTS